MAGRTDGSRNGVEFSCIVDRLVHTTEQLFRFSNVIFERVSSLAGGSRLQRYGGGGSSGRLANVGDLALFFALQMVDGRGIGSLQGGKRRFVMLLRGGGSILKLLECSGSGSGSGSGGCLLLLQLKREC